MRLYVRQFIANRGVVEWFFSRFDEPCGRVGWVDGFWGNDRYRFVRFRAVPREYGGRLANLLRLHGGRCQETSQCNADRGLLQKIHVRRFRGQMVVCGREKANPFLPPKLLYEGDRASRRLERQLFGTALTSVLGALFATSLTKGTLRKGEPARPINENYYFEARGCNPYNLDGGQS